MNGLFDSILGFAQEQLTCVPFPRNMSIPWLIGSTLGSGVLTYLACKHGLKMEHAGIPAMIVGVGVGGVYTLKKATEVCLLG